MAKVVVIVRKVFAALLLSIAAARPDNPNEIARVEAARVRAKAYIAANLATLGIGSVFDLKEKSAFALEPGVVFHFQQLHGGVPVLFGEVVISVGKDVRLSSKKLRQPLEVDLHPRLPGDDAVRFAVEASALSHRANHSDPVLLVIARDSFGRWVPDRDRLAWLVSVWEKDDGTRVPAYNHDFYVAADDGTIIRDIDRVIRD